MVKVKKFVPSKKAAKTPTVSPFLRQLREADTLPILTTDPAFGVRFKGVRKDDLPDDLFYSASIRVDGKGRSRWFVMPGTPKVEDRMRQELLSRQRDAKILGIAVPVGITEYGLSIFSDNTPTPVANEFVQSPAPTKREGVRPNKDKGPGVIDTIIQVLTTEASKAKPMTKVRLLKRLAVLIPDRDPERMASTVRAQLANSGLKAKGVPVRGSDKDGGFWIRKK